MTGQDLARAGRGLEGTPFRLHGRDPATGLDCIGLFAAAMARAGRAVSVPNGYALRARHLPELSRLAAAAGFSPVSDGQALPGDVCMVRPGPVQFHLAIALADGLFVHAHAGLGKVVVTPLSPDWPVVGHWRLIPHS
ncbi:MAG TPA: NlpC/P60 family protein [Novosphingobium sp.]|nr:NlpC/P60 family protein [Novosphingobium sp.]HMP56122.1 NlpC/P60 family protein [Novosphingobium sp.]